MSAKKKTLALVAEIDAAELGVRLMEIGIGLVRPKHETRAPAEILADGIRAWPPEAGPFPFLTMAERAIEYVAECERLQGFPDGWTRIAIKCLKHKPHTLHFASYPDQYDRNPDGSWTRFAADGPRYKAIGNSMAVNVMRWVGWRLSQIEAAE